MLCVIAKIDEAAKARLDGLCRVVEEFGFPPRYLYGHITLVTYLGQEEEKFIEGCKTVLRGQTAFPIRYNRIELLTPTPSIVASPDRTEELCDLHDRLLEIAPSELDMWSSNHRWHPHTTLFYHTEADLRPISQRMQEDFVPFYAQISDVEFSKVTDDGYVIVDSVALGESD